MSLMAKPTFAVLAGGSLKERHSVADRITNSLREAIRTGALVDGTELNQVAVLAGKPSDLQIRLNVGATGEAFVVTAAAVPVQTEPQAFMKLQKMIHQFHFLILPFILLSFQ